MSPPKTGFIDKICSVGADGIKHLDHGFTGVVLVSCSRMEVRPYSYFLWYEYFWGPWVSFVTKDEFSVKATNLFQGLVSHHSLLFCF